MPSQPCGAPSLSGLWPQISRNPPYLDLATPGQGIQTCCFQKGVGRGVNWEAYAEQVAYTPGKEGATALEFPLPLLFLPLPSPPSPHLSAD